jgi:hypothetical protein
MSDISDNSFTDRYSTKRASQAWEEASAPIVRFRTDVLSRACANRLPSDPVRIATAGRHEISEFGITKHNGQSDHSAVPRLSSRSRACVRSNASRFPN